VILLKTLALYNPFTYLLTYLFPFVLLDSLTWSLVHIEPAIQARTGHTALSCPCQFKSRDVNNVLVFGGGDNEGKFFNDLFSVAVPTSISSSVAADTSELRVRDS